jgi:hypothetical protein
MIIQKLSKKVTAIVSAALLGMSCHHVELLGAGELHIILMRSFIAMR